MKITKAGVTRVITVVGSVLAAVDGLLVDQHAISSQVGADIGVIWAAVAGGFGVNVATTAIQERRAAKRAGV